MSASNELIERLNNVPTNLDRLDRRDYETFVTTPNEDSLLSRFQTDRVLSIRDDVPTRVAPVATETFTTDGTAGNTETFQLGNDLIDSATLATNLVLYEAGSKVQPDAVSVANDTFDYTDDGTGNTLRAFYAAGDQARLTLRKRGPNGAYEDLSTFDVGLLHRRDQDERPVYANVSRSLLQRVVPADWAIEWEINAPYTAALATSNPDTEAINASLVLPVATSTAEIDGLGTAVKRDQAVL